MSDYISRADAICEVLVNDGIDNIVDRINKLPSAETHEIRTETHGVCSDLISRADAIDALCHNCAYYTDAQCKTDSGYWCESGAMIREDIPSAEPHNKDAISRDGLLRSWEELSPRGRLEFDQVIMTIPALPSAELPKGDLISRADALNLNCVITVRRADTKERKCDDEIIKACFEAYVEHIKKLPSADAVQGEWVEHTDCEGKTRTITCSKCGWVEHSWIDLNYCPSCGSRMKGGAE